MECVKKRLKCSIPKMSKQECSNSWLSITKTLLYDMNKNNIIYVIVANILIIFVVFDCVNWKYVTLKSLWRTLFFSFCLCGLVLVRVKRTELRLILKKVNHHHRPSTATDQSIDSTIYSSILPYYCRHGDWFDWCTSIESSRVIHCWGKRRLKERREEKRRGERRGKRRERKKTEALLSNFNRYDKRIQTNVVLLDRSRLLTRIDPSPHIISLDRALLSSHSPTHSLPLLIRLYSNRVDSHSQPHFHTRRNLVHHTPSHP